MMSDVMERTLSSIPGLIAGKFGGSDKDQMSGTSRSFQTFIKTIANVRTKHDEEKVIGKEISFQKQKLSQPNMTTAQKRESLVRLVFCNMLGYDVGFCIIHAVKLAQQGTLLEKRVGYLACTLLLGQNDDFLVLLINTIQKDLKSTNVLEVVTALTAINYLVTTEMIPALLPIVEERFSHPKDIVRKKAVICLHGFLGKAPEMVRAKEHIFRQALADRDPSVMWAAVNAYKDLIKLNGASEYDNLVPGLVSTLRQIIGRKLHPSYEYHTSPAPWLMIQLLKLLALLGAGNRSTSEQMYPLLCEVLQRTDATNKMGLSVIYECLETVATIYPKPDLQDHAAKCVGRFLDAKNTNLRYLGLKALTSLVHASPKYAAEYQTILLECLEHKDITIQNKTLELLYRMANPTNVSVICDRLLQFFERISDPVAKTDTVHRLTDLAHRFSTDMLWYIMTMNKVLISAKDFIPKNTENSIISIISKGLLASDTILPKVVQQYWLHLQADDIPNSLIHVAAWVLGEYGSFVTDPAPSEVVCVLIQCFSRSTTTNSTHLALTGALIKLCCYIPIHQVAALSSVCHDSQMKQNITELCRLCASQQKIKIAVNPETRTTKEKLDLSLTFLDNYVGDQLEEGGRPYVAHTLRHPNAPTQQDSNQIFSGLNFGPYATPEPAVSGGGSLYRSVGASTSSPASGSAAEVEETQLELKGVKRVWGKEGVLKPTPDLPHIGEDEQLLKSPEYFPPQASESVSKDDPDIEQRKQLAAVLFSGLNVSPAPSASNKIKASPSLQSSAKESKNQIHQENSQSPDGLQFQDLELLSGSVVSNPDDSMGTASASRGTPEGATSSPKPGRADKEDSMTSQGFMCRDSEMSDLMGDDTVIRPMSFSLCADDTEKGACPSKPWHSVHETMTESLLSSCDFMSPTDEKAPPGSMYRNCSLDDYGADLGYVNVGVGENLQSPSASSGSSMTRDYVIPLCSNSKKSDTEQNSDVKVTSNPESHGVGFLRTFSPSIAMSTSAQSMSQDSVEDLNSPTKSRSMYDEPLSVYQLHDHLKNKHLLLEETREDDTISVDSIEDAAPLCDIPTETSSPYSCRTSTESEIRAVISAFVPNCSSHGEVEELHRCSVLQVWSEKLFMSDCANVVVCMRYRGHGTDGEVVNNFKPQISIEKQIAQELGLPSVPTLAESDVCRGYWLTQLTLPAPPCGQTTTNICLTITTQQQVAMVTISQENTDFLRSHEMTMEVFAVQWGQFSVYEARLNVPTASNTTMDSCLRVLTCRLRLHVLQVMGEECVCAGRWLADPEQILLLHAKLHPEIQTDPCHVTLWIRASHQHLLDTIRGAAPTLWI